MTEWRRGLAVTVSVAAVLMILCVEAAIGQSRTPFRGQRTADGKPNLSGIWQAIGSANWDIEAHEAKPGPVVVLGALGGLPAGLGVVEDGPLPYQPWALAKKKENGEHWLERDPLVKCFLPGVPRATYMPFPFQIVQSPEYVLIAYEFAFASRVINMNLKDEAPIDSWMGWSRGHWEGETLVADVTGLGDESWFDSAGNFHSDALHVVERYTLTSANTISYEATIDDPKVF